MPVIGLGAWMRKGDEVPFYPTYEHRTVIVFAARQVTCALLLVRIRSARYCFVRKTGC